MYIVRFYRTDKKPNEEYYYTRKADAMYHIELFSFDDSNLYRSIELLEINAKNEKKITTVRM